MPSIPCSPFKEYPLSPLAPGIPIKDQLKSFN